MAGAPERGSERPLFSRDCLEVDLDVDGKLLTLYVNHFKSMIGGRDQTRARRAEQVAQVAALVDAAWAPTFDGNFVVVGDFNDYVDAATSLSALVDHPHLVNIVDRLPESERWTHYYASGSAAEKTKQLDYVLLGRALDARAGHPVPIIVRQGLPWRAEAYTGPRFDDVGENQPKASDHCPLAVDVPTAALR